MERHYIGMASADIPKGREHGAHLVSLTPVTTPLPSPAARAEFELAFLKDERRLFGIAFAILRDPQDAEDAVQEVAVHAWKGWMQRRPDASPSAWLSTICVRQCLRQRRRVLRWLAFTSPDRDERDPAFAYVVDAGRYLDLNRAFARLSIRQRTVLTLHYQQGYSLAECARLMGCRAGTAAAHLSRALTKVRKELGDD